MKPQASSDMPPPRDRPRPSIDRPRPNPHSISNFRSQARPQALSSRAAPPSSPQSQPCFSPEDYAPKDWRECFDESSDMAIASREAVFRVYSAGLDTESTVALLLLHGGGHCALSWALIARQMKTHCPLIAYDARGHGGTVAQDESDLSAETQVADAVALMEQFFAKHRPGLDFPKLVICGHSMGGAIAVRIAASNLMQNVVGLVVIDVVEGTAMSALPHMASWLQARTSSFSSVARAIRYVTRAGHVRNLESARLSVPTQLVHCDKSKRWVWRTNLQESEMYWRGWFEGLSQLFLSVPAAKMLVLAGVDRLDRDLMIGQMQGKFQSMLIPTAGHTVHEDQPEQTAQVLLDYLQRNLFLQLSDSHDDSPIFQQRRPIPPCR